MRVADTHCRYVFVMRARCYLVSVSIDRDWLLVSSQYPLGIFTANCLYSGSIMKQFLENCFRSTFGARYAFFKRIGRYILAYIRLGQFGHLSQFSARFQLGHCTGRATQQALASRALPPPPPLARPCSTHLCTNAWFAQQGVFYLYRHASLASGRRAGPRRQAVATHADVSDANSHCCSPYGKNWIGVCALSSLSPSLFLLMLVDFFFFTVGVDR